MKNKLVIFASIALVAFGLYGLSGSLLQSEEPQAPVQVEEEKIKVWTLKQHVSRGDLIDRNHFEIAYIPESEALKKGISEDVNLEMVEGAVFRKSLGTDQLVYPEDIVHPNADGYINYVIAPNRVPYAVEVSPSDVVGGMITNGSLIDVVALSLPGTEIADTSLRRTMSITPVLIGIKALQIKRPLSDEEGDADEVQKVSVILELTRKQVATLTVAKRISELEIHRSIGEYAPEDLAADAGDVLADFRSIKEFRAGTSDIK
ncbi:Flp pilus assembly protein CpaB [Vibrio nigripulchritudo]|uniref:Flp pilus assembly protein CpaB n=1 Tax=Vibrio nigripulchritudo TaxID=28173 RepID=UPI00190E44D7|nr:Flp pilus assembly protein CpaB [Vibrio nigripulchritudo]BDU33669.1 Flp pilus assembly protein CpaB [Vibrio nigripulchritudo]